MDGAFGIEKYGNYIVVASEVSDAIQLIDVSTPSSPVASGFIRDAVTSAHRLNGARDLVIEGNYAYIASSADDSIAVIDLEIPSTPTQLTRLTNNNSTILLDGVSGIFKSGNYLYTAGYLQNALQIVEITGKQTTNPTAINTTSIAYTGVLSTITETP